MAMNIITGPAATQGTIEWLIWRQNGIGASEAAIVMGTSPWLTAYTLFRQKLGLEPPMKPHYWTERGKRLEPLARKAYEKETREIMVPMIGESGAYPFIRASFDGLSFSSNQPLEIKCPADEAHRMALAGVVPAYYYDQVQQQLFVSEADMAHYYSFDGNTGKLLEVRRDQARIDAIVEADIRFWERVQAGAWSSDDWTAAAETWVLINKEMEALKEREENARAALVSLLSADEKKREGGGVIVTRVSRKGSVDYDAMLAAKGVTVTDEEKEQFRKGSSETIQVKASKESPEIMKAASVKPPKSAEPPAPPVATLDIPENFVLEM